MKTLINLTPHPITLPTGNVIPASGDVVRLEEKSEYASEFAGPDGVGYNGDKYYIDPGTVPIIRKWWGAGNLPERKQDTYYIVSALVANAYPDRDDLLVPETKRRENGEIYATALIRNSGIPSHIVDYFERKSMNNAGHVLEEALNQIVYGMYPASSEEHWTVTAKKRSEFMQAAKSLLYAEPKKCIETQAKNEDDE